MELHNRENYGTFMIKKLAFSIFLAASTAAFATTYTGNGNTSFGGGTGNGSLTLTDNGTTISGSFTVGAGGLGGNPFVLYIQSPSAASGFASTTGFNDSADQLRGAISGFTSNQNAGGPGQSTLNFGGGAFT